MRRLRAGTSGYGEVRMKKNTINKYAILITRGILFGGGNWGSFRLGF